MAVPTRIHAHRPHRSDRTPINGFNTMPVSVETETMKPRRTSPAPSVAAKKGNSGVLPIWYAERTMKSAAVMHTKPRDGIMAAISGRWRESPTHRSA